MDQVIGNEGPALSKQISLDPKNGHWKNTELINLLCSRDGILCEKDDGELHRDVDIENLVLQLGNARNKVHSLESDVDNAIEEVFDLEDAANRARVEINDLDRKVFSLRQKINNLELVAFTVRKEAKELQEKAKRARTDMHEMESRFSTLVSTRYGRLLVCHALLFSRNKCLTPFCFVVS